MYDRVLRIKSLALKLIQSQFLVCKFCHLRYTNKVTFFIEPPTKTVNMNTAISLRSYMPGLVFCSALFAYMLCSVSPHCESKWNDCSLLLLASHPWSKEETDKKLLIFGLIMPSSYSVYNPRFFQSKHCLTIALSLHLKIWFNLICSHLYSCFSSLKAKDYTLKSWQTIQWSSAVQTAIL